MTVPAPALGDIVEVYCSRCRHNLDANVAAVEGVAAKKVQCRTCWNIVPFKPPVDMEARREKHLKRLLRLQEKKRQAEQPAAAAAPPPSADRAEWERLTADFDLRYAKPYDRHRKYAAQSFVLHKKLGVGAVESATEDHVVVLFKDARVELEHDQPRED